MRASRIVFVVLIWLAALRSVTGQAVTPEHAMCRDPHRADKCANYLLLELNFSARGPGTDLVEPGCSPPSADFCRRRLLQEFIAADVGMMRNLDLHQSAGASFEAGGSDDGVRLALLGRYRRWFSDQWVADASLGPLMTQISRGGNGLVGTTQTYGATGDVSIGRARVALVTVGFDAARQLGHNAKALRAGIRCESKGLAIGGALVVAGLVAVYAALGSGGY